MSASPDPHDPLKAGRPGPRWLERAWSAFVVVVLLTIAGGLWASPEYRDDDSQTGVVGLVENVSVVVAAVGCLGALGALVLWVLRARWWRGLLSVGLMVGTIWVLMVSFSTID